MTESNLFEHVGHMLWDTIPAFFISLIIYGIIGLNYVSSNVKGTDEINSLMFGLENTFNLTPILFILPIITIILAVKKTPAIPTLLSVSISGGIFALIFQSATLVSVFSAFTSGFNAQSDITMINDLFNRGGINSMGGTIILLITAAALGGIMQKVGILQTIVSKIMNLVKGEQQLLVTSLISSFLIGLSTGAQVLAIIIPGKMFSSSFKKMNLHSKNLSRIVEAGGTVGITLVPWGVPAIFAANMLGVAPGQFIPFLFFPMLAILFNLIYGVTGISIAKTE